MQHPIIVKKNGIEVEMLKDESKIIVENYDDRVKLKEKAKHKTHYKVNKSRLLKIFMVLFLIGLWSGIIYKGVEIGKQYMDEAIFDIEMQNNLNHQEAMIENERLYAEISEDVGTLNSEIVLFKSDVKGLNEAIDLFSLEVQSLKSSIDFIDSSVANSIVVQGEIGNKIQSLDTRLQELKRSLNILLEAP
jgi:hypothetical protein